MLYRCHCDLWDMAYPLKIHDQIVGVLFGGQMIVRRKKVLWQKELEDIYEYVSWDYSDSDLVFVSNLCQLLLAN